MASALGLLATNVSVSEILPDSQEKADVRPAHHANDAKTKFANPWPSFREVPSFRWRIVKEARARHPEVPKDLEALVHLQKPNWGAGSRPEAIKATWLGHACYLVEFPSPAEGVRGPRVLFDPALSHRCSPFTWMGPARLTPVPCPIDDIPAVDAIVLSHNHYDHTDSATLQKLFTKYKPQIFAPLGNGCYFQSLGIPASHTHILDWWDARALTLTLAPAPDAPGAATALRITCTPCQHTAARGPWDRDQTLWASWAVASVPPAGQEPRSVWFAGDTGYRTVFAGEDEAGVPVCPAFREIGARMGPVDLALIPIGAYMPRDLFSNVHSSPADSVRIFRDVRARKALAMHWGTWILTTEDIMEPPKLLAKEAAALGIPEGDFDVCGLGETRFF
ncbi:metal-dependent hydrolase [Phanerochaete sordida]|uniref:Metal-dependent hydrolase n=1 Tax=Phanerochaete sordida TaxID=48140 RepID=A0A9P3GI63_9APHY|nr:metal-dependent hydrolase [Phanerochaete sordida]